MITFIVLVRPKVPAKKIQEFAATLDGILGPLRFVRVMPFVYLGPPTVGIERVVQMVGQLTLAREVVAEIIYSRHTRRRRI